MLASTLLALLSFQDAVGLPDLAACFLRLETTLDERPPGESERAGVNLAFDAATKRFFTADFGAAVQELDALRCALLPEEARQAARLCSSLRLVVEPPVAALGSGSSLVVRVESVYEVLLDEALELEARVVVRDAGGAVRAAAVVALSDEEPVELELELTADPAPIAPESFAVELLGPGGRVHAAARWGVAPATPADAAAANRRALEALDLDALATAARVFRARNRLLVADQSTDASALSRLDPVALQLELADELDALRDGLDPFVGRRGDLWRVVAVGEAELPLRLFVPDERADVERLPVVVALHGAGGNEHLFFDGYGRGALRDEAERRGFVLAAPSSYAFLRDDAAFDALLNELARCHPVDAERVFVLGHSLGAGAAARLARSRGEQIAAVACLAGGGRFEERADAVPLFVALGELDSIVPSAPLAAGAERARAAGRQVELLVLGGRGHTLMVPDALPAALDFFELGVR